MTTVFLHASGPPADHQLIAADLEAVGITVLTGSDLSAELLHEVVSRAPDMLVCANNQPGDDIFAVLQTLNETLPRPVVMFTNNSDTAHIQRAVDAGVHAYVVNGYDRYRLKTLLHLAEARFNREQALRDEMQSEAGGPQDRQVVERAMAMLMRAGQVSDDGAFALLCNASLHTHRRLGQMSQHIIASARFAEVVNRAGQLRMLSQRLVTLALLRQAAVSGVGIQDQLDESVKRVDDQLAALGMSLSLMTFGDLLGTIALTWSRMRHLLQGDLPMQRLLQLDVLAGQLLREAEHLTIELESVGATAPLRVLNLAGRQRMLSQRFVKHALLERFDVPQAAAGHRASMAECSAAFDDALSFLETIPLTSPEIRAGLANVAHLWGRVRHHVAAAPLGDASATSGDAQPGHSPEVWLQGLAMAGEALLQDVEVLAERYERSMQMLLA